MSDSVKAVESEVEGGNRIAAFANESGSKLSFSPTLKRFKLVLF